jgi:hypothetical protein
MSSENWTYDIERDNAIIATGVPTRVYNDLGVTPGLRTYRIRAVNEYGAGEWSGPVQVLVEGGDPGEPFEFVENFEYEDGDFPGVSGGTWASETADEVTVESEAFTYVQGVGSTTFGSFSEDSVFEFVLDAAELNLLDRSQQVGVEISYVGGIDSFSGTGTGNVNVSFEAGFRDNDNGTEWLVQLRHQNQLSPALQGAFQGSRRLVTSPLSTAAFTAGTFDFSNVAQGEFSEEEIRYIQGPNRPQNLTASGAAVNIPQDAVFFIRVLFNANSPEGSSLSTVVAFIIDYVRIYGTSL